ncbi:MAG: hypothetical protein HOK49_06300 [Opitutae bacterium]|nr:hypothetical protein [Opitutae bacterium]
MAQSRNASQAPGQNPKGEGMQLNSTSGAAIIAGHMDYDALQELQRKSELDWGKLPSQMAKDLIEGSKENISGEYRHQVQTYFRAIAELARQKKEKK